MGSKVDGGRRGGQSDRRREAWWAVRQTTGGVTKAELRWQKAGCYGGGWLVADNLDATRNR